MKTIDDFKSEYNNLRPPGKSRSSYETDQLIENMIEIIRRQDEVDRKYLFLRRILPVSIGIVLLTIVFLMVNVPNIVVFIGCSLIYSGLVGILILFIRDYYKVVKEDYGISIRHYLINKKNRLLVWKRTPVAYHLIFGVYISGVVFMIMGNTKHYQILLNSSQNVILFALVNMAVLVISGIIGEYKYRKRHKKNHEPLIKSITEMINELCNDVST